MEVVNEIYLYNRYSFEVDKCYYTRYLTELVPKICNSTSCDSNNFSIIFKKLPMKRFRLGAWQAINSLSIAATVMHAYLYESKKIEFNKVSQEIA